MTVAVSDRKCYILDALFYSGGSHRFEDIEQGVAEGQLQFWPGPNSVIITEIIASPRRKALNFFLAGGNMAELKAMTPSIEQWARSRGCTSACLTGRKGWEKTWLVREAGYEPRLVVFEKAL